MENHTGDGPLDRDRILSNESPAVWKVEHEDPQPVHIREGQADVHDITLHNPPDARRNGAEEIVELQICDDFIGDIEEQLEPVFRLFALVYIRTQAIPAHDASFRVPLGDSAHMEPAEYAISPTETALRVKWLPGFERAIPRGQDTRTVVGVNHAVGPSFHLVKWFSKVIPPLLIDEFDVAVHRKSNNMSRNAIDDSPTILIARAQGLVG